MLTFMALKVLSVIFCTSSAWMVALNAREFCSNQNCTAFNSSIRFWMSSTFRVGATQPAAPVEGLAFLLAAWVRFCKKSNPGTSFPKSKAED